MSGQMFNRNGSRYKPYVWYFFWTISVTVGLCLLLGGIYTLAVFAPVVLGYIGLSLAALMFLMLIALIAWIAQDARG